MRQADEALTDVEKALELSPEEEALYLLRGQIYESQGNLDAAHEDYQYVLDLNPFNEDAYVMKGKLLIKQGKPAEAADLFTDAIELKPRFRQGPLPKEDGPTRCLENRKRRLKI